MVAGERQAADAVVIVAVVEVRVAERVRGVRQRPGGHDRGQAQDDEDRAVFEPGRARAAQHQRGREQAEAAGEDRDRPDGAAAGVVLGGLLARALGVGAWRSGSRRARPCSSPPRPSRRPRAAPRRTGPGPGTRRPDPRQSRSAGGRAPVSDRGGRTRGTRWPSAASFADRAGRVKVARCRGRVLLWRHGLAAGARSERRRRRRGHASPSGRRAGARCRCGSSTPRARRAPSWR